MPAELVDAHDGAGINLAGISDSGPILRDHGRALFFSSNRSGDGFRLYAATRPSAAQPFGLPRLIEGLPMDGAGSDPWLSHDLHRIVYSRGGSMFETTR